MNSTYRDDVPLLVNMGGGVYSEGSQGAVPQYRILLIDGLTEAQARGLLEAGGTEAMSRFGTLTEYQAAYNHYGLIPALLAFGDLPYADKIAAQEAGVPGGYLYQNSNSVAYIVAEKLLRQPLQMGGALI